MKGKSPRINLLHSTIKLTKPLELMIRPNIIRKFELCFSSARLDVFPRAHPNILGVGKERLVLSLGSFYGPNEDKPIHLAAKIYIWPEGFITATKRRIASGRGLDKMPHEFLNDPNYLDDHYFLNHNSLPLIEREKRTLDKIAGLHIPAVWSKVIKFKLNDKDFGFLLVEDLSSGRRFNFFEYAEIDKKPVANLQELKIQFKTYKEILQKSGIKVTEEGKHTPSSIADLDLELSKTFFVVVDPKTKIGKLVVADVDQISF
jgi:hypothetical protein